MPQLRFAASEPWDWLAQLLSSPDGRSQLKALCLLGDLALEEAPQRPLLDAMFAGGARCAAVVDAVSCCSSSDAVEKVCVCVCV